MNAIDHDRRRFLARASLFGAGAVLLLCGCGGGGDKKESAQASGGDQAAGGAKAAQPTACDDLSGLTPAQIQVRQAFEYKEKADNPAESCHLCEFYKQPEAGQFCGGCKLFVGPVNPGGHCNSFSAA